MSVLTKADLRKQVTTLLSNQKEEERLEKSLIIQKKLFDLQEFQNSNVILFYASFKGEVSTTEMIIRAQQLGKKIGLPRVNVKEKAIIPTLVENLDENLENGPYGIKEPKETAQNRLAPHEIDMVVVPAVAFDKANYRLGRGGGYYDRFLKGLSSDIPTVGLAFDFQIVETLPQLEDHDIPVSLVLAN